MYFFPQFNRFLIELPMFQFMEE